MKHIIALILTSIITVQCYAATYTSIASGNFSSTTTWQGGLVPPTSLPSGDKIVILQGSNVVLNTNISITASGTLEVYGQLIGGSGNYLEINSGTLSGTGVIDLDSISTAATTSINFDGTFRANKLYSSQITYTMPKGVQVNQRMHINTGIVTLDGTILSLSKNVSVIINGGRINYINSGNINIVGSPSNLKVIYIGASTTTGEEVSDSSKLNNIEVAVETNNTVKLGSFTAVNGELRLTSGMLHLNGQRLVLSKTSSFKSAIGKFFSTPLCTLSIMSKLPTDTIKFAAGGDTLSSLLLLSGDIGGHKGIINIGSNVAVKDRIHILSKVNINQYNLAKLPASIVMNRGNYIITEYGGSFTSKIEANNYTWYPLGTDKHATHVSIYNHGATATYVTISVKSDVKANGKSGSSIASIQPVVDATWDISSTTTSGLNLALNLEWQDDMEVNSFDRKNCYISLYQPSGWDSVTSSPSKNVDPYFPCNSQQRLGITSLGSFAVFDVNTSVGIDHIAKKLEAIQIHPNPATSEVTITSEKMHTVCIKNISGATVYQQAVSANSTTINTSQWSAGMYIATIEHNDGTVVHKKIIKQ